jgi:hypothetical protein
MRLTALLCFVAAPCMAQDVHEWGEGTPSRVRLHTCAAAVACVTFDNQFNKPLRDPDWTPLMLGGVHISVFIEFGKGMAPDTVTVYPPEGLIAIPPSVTVEENASGTVMLFSADGAGA